MAFGKYKHRTELQPMPAPTAPHTRVEDWFDDYIATRVVELKSKAGCDLTQERIDELVMLMRSYHAFCERRVTQAFLAIETKVIA